MSQKDALKLAKDVYEFDLKATYSGAASWVTPAEQSIADEIVIDSPPVSRVSGTFGLGLSKLNLASWKS
jgi:hypothetical protein